MIPLVLVHGFMGGSAHWEHLIKRVESRRDLLAIDLPGFGKNNPLPAIDRIDHFAEWVIAELRSDGVERYHLLGHSMGDMIVRPDQQNIEHLILYGIGAFGTLPDRFETIAKSKARANTDGIFATARGTCRRAGLQRFGFMRKKPQRKIGIDVLPRSSRSLWIVALRYQYDGQRISIGENQRQ